MAIALASDGVAFRFNAPACLTYVPRAIIRNQEGRETMRGYQFLHMETYSVKGAPGANPDSTAKKKSGQRAWTVQEILAEAERQRLASLHVAEGGPPIEILPGTVSSFDALRDAHAAAVAKKEDFSYTNKDGSTAKRSRKLRSDAPTLYTALVSLPVTSGAAIADPALRSQCREVLQAAMAQESRRIEALGGKMMLGVLHLDESHVHAHLYALDPARGRVDHLHPGKSAKKAFLDENAGTGDPKALRTAGNRAYCDAMRGWQDDMYDNVFSAAGLLRVGPRTERLTTTEYNKRKKARAMQAAEARQAAALAAQVQKQKDEIAQALQTAEETERALNRQAADLQADKIDLLVRESEAASLAVLSRQEIAQAQAIAADAAAIAAGLARGMDAVESREIDYRPAIAEKPATLVFGPNAPTEKSRREKLKEAIRPAYELVLGFARRVFRLREREAALAAAEADRQAREKALVEAEAARAVRTRDLREEAAEVRRRASVVEAALRQAGQAAPSVLQDVAAERSVALSEASFPGAWAVSREENREDLLKRLNATTNLDLRAAYQATRDAMMLTDHDAVLRARFARGAQVLVMAAEHRGFDLKTGRQDLAKAKSPAIAALHRDELVEKGAVKRKPQDRQRHLGN